MLRVVIVVSCPFAYLGRKSWLIVSSRPPQRPSFTNPRSLMKPPVFALLLFCALVAAPAAAQTTPDTNENRPAVTAVRLAAPLNVDGRLDEDLYSNVQPTSAFVQTEPASGSPATERTDVWVSFD